MAKFVFGADTEVKSEEPLLEVQAAPGARIPIGKHVFRLVVADDANNVSDPASITVIVFDADKPTAVIDFVDERNTRIPDPEVRVQVGRPIKLTGERSKDPSGDVKLYRWALFRA